MTILCIKELSTSFPNTITLVDLVELDMVDFDVILERDLFDACFASFNFRTSVV